MIHYVFYTYTFSLLFSAFLFECATDRRFGEWRVLF